MEHVVGTAYRWFSYGVGVGKNELVEQHKNVTGNLFNTGIVIGIATFFYFPAIAFAALIIVGLVILRPFRLAEWMVSLLGILTPWYFLLSYVFLTDRWKGYKMPGVTVSLPKFYDNKWALAAIIIVLFTTLVGFYFIRKNFCASWYKPVKAGILFFYILLWQCLFPSSTKLIVLSTGYYVPYHFLPQPELPFFIPK